MADGMGINDYQFGKTGRITSPGKFEGEMVYLPHFYEVSLDGTADMVGGKVRIEIDSSDLKALREDIDRERDPDRKVGLMTAMTRLKRKRSVRFIERDDGLVQEV